MSKFIASSLILIILSFTAFTKDKGVPAALLSLITAERAFAKTSVDKGVRAAFIAFLAPDGINFQPHPTRTLEAYRQRPAPAKQAPVILNWAPVYGDVAASGELGYTTGPFVLDDSGPSKTATRHGLFFSIWKKQPDGKWKVVVDMGVQTPSAFAALNDPFQQAGGAKVKPGQARGKRSDMLSAEKQFFDLATSEGSAKAWQKYLSNDACVYRQGMMPVIGQQALREWAERQAGSLSQGGNWMPEAGWTKTGMARSGELGYTSGGYQAKVAEGQTEQGYYTRIWRRDAKGDWRIVFDVADSLAQEQK